MKTLKEICEITGITRRQLQGFEAAGLVKHTDKNKMGHLMYDDEEEEKIKTVTYYHMLGFKYCEIKELLNADEKFITIALEMKQIELLEEKEGIESLIEMIDKRLK